VRHLPGARDHLADPAHGLGVGGGHGQGAHVVEHVLGGDGRGADPRLGEGQVLRHAGVEVVADHEHVEVLGDRVHRVRQGGVGGTGKNVRVARDREDVRGVTTAGALCVERVDRAALDRGDGGLEVAGLVEAVRVQGHLQAPAIRGGERGVDRGGRGAPVLVDLVAARAGEGLLGERLGADRVALAHEQDVHREVVQAAVDRTQVPGAGGHRGGLGALGRSGTATKQGGQARGQRLDHLGRGDEMDVRVDAARGEDLALTADDVRGRADVQVGVDAVRDVRVAGAAQGHDAPVPDADIGADDAPPVQDHGAGDHGVQGAVGPGGDALGHRLADRLAAAEHRLVAAEYPVFLDLDPQVGVAQAHLIARGGAVQRGVALAGDLNHPRLRGCRGPQRCRGSLRCRERRRPPCPAGCRARAVGLAGRPR